MSKRGEPEEKTEISKSRKDMVRNKKKLVIILI